MTELELYELKSNIKIDLLDEIQGHIDDLKGTWSKNDPQRLNDLFFEVFLAGVDAGVKATCISLCGDIER